MLKNKRGRPKENEPINCQLLREACEARYPGRKLTSVYADLAEKFIRVGKRTVRGAFYGKATPAVRTRLESHFGLEPGALLLSNQSPDELLASIRARRSELDEHVRHHTEQGFRRRSSAMLELSPVIHEALKYVGTADMELSGQLEVLDVVEWHVSYRHLVEDSPANEEAILELLQPAMDVARRLIERTLLSQSDYAHVCKLLGEFHHNWIPPTGDVWKRDVLPVEETNRAVYFHQQGVLHFRHAAQAAADPEVRRQHKWREFIELECQSRLYAKSGQVEHARECLHAIEPLVDQFDDELVRADLAAVKAIIANSGQDSRERSNLGREAISLYGKHLGDDHHLPLALTLFLWSNDPDAVTDSELERAVEFFRKSSMKAHWLVDLQKANDRIHGGRRRRKHPR